MVTRTEAVERINDAIGWRLSGHAKEAAIIRRLVEAQRKLEKGVTLPRFLMEEGYAVTLLQGDHSVDLPPGFLRLNDENLPHYTSLDTRQGIYLVGMDYISGYSFISSQQRPDEINITTRAPTIFVIRNTTLDFITTANQDYDLVIDYYKAADSLATATENAWLDNAPDWLIGEAGVRIAADLRDVDAVNLFQQMRIEGQRTTFNEIIEQELQSGPFIMGGQN